MPPLQVFRRIHCTAELGWMNERDIGEYFRRFLCGFIPCCPAEQWDSPLTMPLGKLLHQGWQRDFLQVEAWSGKRNISIDMLQQFLMHQITATRLKPLILELSSPGKQLRGLWQVPSKAI